jgi:hypothetical protein
VTASDDIWFHPIAPDVKSPKFDRVVWHHGPKGTIESRYYKALCGAFESYVKLKPVERDANLNQTFLEKLVVMLL